MYFKATVVLFVLILSATMGQRICPPADSVAPCTCEELAEKKIRCASIRGRWDIKATFQNFSSLVDSSVIFDTLELYDTSLFEIPAGAVETLKFRTIDFMMNRDLEWISPDAFEATLNVTTEISLWNNYLKNDAPYETDLFDFFNKFVNVESIWLPTNAITSIPANAFSSLPKLYDLYFGSNSIRSIGANAFSNLPALAKLYFSHNLLSNEGIAEGAFEGVSSLLDITLQSNNEIDHVDELKFRPLLDRATKVAVGPTYCGHNGCTYVRLQCDQRADWLCPDVEKYRPVLNGFHCLGGVYENVWEYCGNKTGSLN